MLIFSKLEKEKVMKITKTERCKNKKELQRS